MRNRRAKSHEDQRIRIVTITKDETYKSDETHFLRFILLDANIDMYLDTF
jgi:hypothetical protein